MVSALVAVLLFASVHLTEAQQPTKQPRIGFLFIGSKDQPHMEKVRQGMRDLGYVEGKNILIEYRYTEGNADTLPRLATELVGLNLDVILYTTPAANRALLHATSTIPIVSVAGNPLGSGPVKNLARPGGNLTDLTATAGPGMYGKRVEI